MVTFVPPLSDLLIADSFANSIDVSAFSAQLVINKDPNMPVPEPVSVSVFILGLLGLTLRYRVKKTV